MPPATSAEPTDAFSGRVPRRRWRIAFLLGLGVIVNYLDRVNVSVSQAALHASFGISVVTFGFLLSAYSWTYALMQLPSGVLLDRFGVRLVGRAGAFLWSIASFGAAMAPGVGSFIAARFLLGVGEGPTFPGNAKAIGEWFPQNERSLATAITDSAAKFSAALGVPLVGLLLIHFGWRLSFAATGLISFLYFLIFYWVYCSPDEDTKLSAEERALIAAGGGVAVHAPADAPGNSLLFLMKQPKVIGLAMGWGAYNYTFYLLLTWMPSYLQSALGIDLLHSVLYTSVPWLFATVADLFFGGWLVDFLITRGWNPLRVRRSVMVGGLICGMGILGAAHAHTAVGALCWISLSLGGLSASAPVAWTVPALIAPPGGLGKVGGITNLASQLAGISAPIITGFIVAATHTFSSAFVTATAILLIGIFGYGVLLGRMEPIVGPK